MQVSYPKVTIYCRVVQNLEPHEFVLGLYHVKETSAQYLPNTVKDVLQRFNIPIQACRDNYAHLLNNDIAIDSLQTCTWV